MYWNSRCLSHFGKGVRVYGPAARQPPLQFEASVGADDRAVRRRCDSAGWQQQLYSACMGRHAQLCSSVDYSADGRFQAVAEAEGFPARRANQLLGRTGTLFWQEERYNHLVRNPREFGRIEAYIVQNPAQAGLAPPAEEFAWSSASKSGTLKPAPQFGTQ